MALSELPITTGMASPRKGVLEIGYGVTRTDFALNSMMGRGAQDVTTSTDATSATCLIECPIAQRSIQSSAGKKAPVQRPSAPLKPQVLARYLHGYDPVLSDYLVKGFSKGFRVESESLEKESLGVDNPQLPNHLLLVLGKKLQKEIDVGRILGPLNEVPLPNFQVSPIKLAPKRVSGEYRFIHNLSYPYDEEAVNTPIPQDRVSVHYVTVNNAISHIKEVGVTSHLAKTDIKSAFRIIPIHPDNHHLLGMKWQTRYYYDTMLPMGCSMSCAIF